MKVLTHLEVAQFWVCPKRELCRGVNESGGQCTHWDLHKFTSGCKKGYCQGIRVGECKPVWEECRV